MLEGPRLRPRTALGIWLAGLVLAFVLSALATRLDSSNLRDAAGVLFTLLVWEAFLKSFVLGWVLLPVWGITRLKRRKARSEEFSRFRHKEMTLTAERLRHALHRQPTL